jgi:hypothetical protein
MEHLRIQVILSPPHPQLHNIATLPAPFPGHVQINSVYVTSRGEAINTDLHLWILNQLIEADSFLFAS